MSLIKSILKRVLPTPLLKDAFLVYNKFKILTVDRLLFSEFKIRGDRFFIYQEEQPFKNVSIDSVSMPVEVKNYMANWSAWKEVKFILILNQSCCIEPEYGWAIVKSNQLVYYSLGMSRTWFQPKPNLYKFWRRTDEVRIEKAISLRDTGEENYFHFYNDLLGKLFFLRQHSVEVEALPIIISKRLWDKEYFQFYLKNSEFLQSLKWIIQDRQYVRCESIIFCKPLTHQKDLWDLAFAPLISRETSTQASKIFLTRNKSRLRFIENADEIERIAARYGFAIVDADTLTPSNQAELFFNAGFIVGIHGAGLTNMSFRKGSCRVMELFPPPDLGYLPYHYIMLAKMFGFQYTAMIGEPGRVLYSGGFYLPASEFESGLLKFCQ